MPFFSIIIPTYNRWGYLDKAIKSLRSQNFTGYEIIVVDDGSTDLTNTEVKNLAQEDSRIRYFLKQNEERSIARNFGIIKATGQYVGFLDSDDFVYPNHLSVGYDLLRKNNFPEVGHLGYQFVDASGSPILIRNNFDDSFKSTLIRENIIHGNAIFIRRDIATQINFIDSPFAILSEDWYLWLRLAARFKFHFDNTVTSAVNQHSERSLMNISPDKLIANTNLIVESLKKDDVFLKAYKSKVAYHFANHYTFLSLILAMTRKRRRETVKYLLKAIGYDLKVVFRRRFLASVKHLL